MDYECLKIEQQDGIAIMAVSVRQTLNALNSKVLSEIDHFVEHLDKSVRVLIVTGDGEKAFVAGADIAEMKDKNQQEAYEFSRKGALAFRKIEELDIPVIAAVNGYALGGGCELAMACDIRLASEKAKFGQPEIKLGIIPGFSGTCRLAKLVGPSVAKELIFTGKTIDSHEALRIGLVNAVYAPENLMDEAMNMAKTIIANAPIAMAYAKKCIDNEYYMNVDDAIAFENEYFGKCFATEDQKEGMSAFLGKRKAQFRNK